MPAEWFADWKQAYEQAMWGEEREDLRRMAWERLGDPEADGVSPVYPYFANEDEQIERAAELAKRSKAMDSEAIAAKFAKAREEHYRKHPKRG